MNEAIDLLDDSIGNIGVPYKNVVIVDLRPVFATHEWGDSDSCVARLRSCNLVELAIPWSECWWVPGIHPNAAGQREIASTIWAPVERRIAGQP